MKLAFDSNVLLYLARVWKHDTDKAKSLTVDTLLLKLPNSIEIVVPYQVLGECYAVMQRYSHSREKCRETVLDWKDNFSVIPSSGTAFLAAIDLATQHKLQIWDALILNVAAEAGCQLLLSEDLQSGFGWRGVTVVNPFAATLDPQLARLLSGPE